MKVECTISFAHYREVVRSLWNLGFYTKPELRNWNCERSYDEAVARLFEGMILRPLGISERVDPTFAPGLTAYFAVETVAGNRLLVNRNSPDEPGGIWGHPILEAGQARWRLRFMGFVDWDVLGMRDFQYIRVLVEEIEGRPDLAGRHALIESGVCSIWLEQDTDE